MQFFLSIRATRRFPRFVIRIVERGQHKDLVSAGGVYQELYETQFSKALTGDAPESGRVTELEEYMWGAAPGDEPAD